MSSSRTVIGVAIHHLEQARAAVAAAGRQMIEIELWSAPDAAAYAGVGYLHAVEAELGRPLTIDCGDDAGLVMAALRTGCRSLAYSGPEELFHRLNEMAKQVGAVLHHEPRATAPVVVLDPDDDGPQIMTRLAHILRTPPGVAAPKKEV